MSQIPRPFGSFRQPSSTDYGAQGQASSQAIASFFNAVYAWMCAGLALTAVTAWYVAGHPDILASVGRGGILVLCVLELVLVGVISAAVQRISASVATVLFLAYAAINGVVLSMLLLIYAHTVLASAFAITAGTFGAMSLYGFITRRDLTALGSLMFMALIGLIIASVVSIFWHNSMLQVLINYVGVIVFVGLTAYDTQKLKQVAIATSNNAAMAARLSISGALMLYLDFLNLFIFIVQILGNNNRRD